jgi:hypothetical protein
MRLKSVLVLLVLMTFCVLPVEGRDATGQLRASLERLLERLDLSDAKKQEVKAVLDEHKPHVDELISREATARAELRDAIERRNNPAGDIRDAADALAAVEHDLALERAEIWLDLLPLFGDEQRVKILRFMVSTESQSTPREKEAALPLEKIAKTDKLSDEAKAAIDGIIAENKGAVSEEAAGLDQGRMTLLILIQQPDRDENLLAKGSEPIAAAAKKLALVAGDVWSPLLDQLAEKQRDSYRKYSASQDAEIVERHRVLALLFLELL